MFVDASRSEFGAYVSRAHALSAAHCHDRSSDNKEARMIRTARHYLLQWLAWRARSDDAQPCLCREAVVELSRTSTTST